MFRKLNSIVAAAVAIMLMPQTITAQSPVRIIQTASEVLQEIQAIPHRGIPAALLADAQGIAIIPDVLLGAHVAPLQFAFYNATQFPESYRGGVFIAEHGSWNRATRSGYQVVFVGMKDGKANADPVPFLTGFVGDPKGSNVFGRPVGVTVAPDGSLLVSDDGTATIYRISYAK